MKALTNVIIVTNGQMIKNKSILFDQQILELTETLPNDVEVIDGQGYYVSAGFIDQHIHGAGGMDVMDGTLDALDVISKAIVRTGVTNFLPTTMTMEWDKIELALDCVRAYQGNEKGAEILGVHLEGPFINPMYKGAQRADTIKKPDYELIHKNMDIIKRITYSPELDEDLVFTNAVLKNSDAVLSIGHSNCSMELALKVHELGVRNITHCFNGMNSFHHRSPGIIGALFVKSFYVEYIADCIHSDIRMLRGFIDKTGKSTTILISDAMRASLLAAGEFDLGGQKVIVDEVSARLLDGTLAGSILKVNQAVKNIISEEIALPEAIKMVTENPAKALGVWEFLGSLEKGKRGNMVLFDQNIGIRKVFIQGMEVYCNNSGM